MKPVFFTTPREFRHWLEDNHATATELWVGYYKIAKGDVQFIWSDSVDQALCFGWIDGVRKSIDKDTYCIRFSPRKKNSIWSLINIKKVEILMAQGLMTENGLKAFKSRNDAKSGIYSHETAEAILPKLLQQIFEANPTAWRFFSIQSHSYKKQIIHWIVTAKQEQTQINRLQKVIDVSKIEKRLR